MELSKYNEFIAHEADNEKIYLYNFSHLKALTLDIRLAKIIRENEKHIDNLVNIHPELYGVMMREGFIVDNTHKESQLYAIKVKEQLESDNHVRITINPTLDCNLKCWYCYEDHLKGSIMNDTTINNVVKLVKSVVSSDTLEAIDISFFGGEPLLYFRKVVLKILDRASILCKERGKLMSVQFTTNGVCMTKKVIDTLLAYEFPVSFQIAFDGNERLHNQVKFLPGNKGVYNTVRQNIIYALSKGMNVIVRCNYTKDNILSFYDVVMDFKQFHNKKNLRFSFHKVWQENDSQNLEENEKLLKDKLKELSFQSDLTSSWGGSLNMCYADYKHNYVINYNGDVYKCTARDFKPVNRIGYLDNNGSIIIVSSKTYFFGLSNLCVNCRMLPLCNVCSQKRKESTYEKCLNPELLTFSSESIKNHFFEQ